MDYRQVAAMSELLRYELRETAEQPDACVIWLHGLGADGHDFADIVPMLGLPESLKARFVFPHAPVMPVTINAGWPMPAWYDILAMSPARTVDNASFLRSVEQIEALIAEQIEKGIAADRILLVGFSQGGAMAYDVGLNHSPKIAGVAALSTYLAIPERVTDEGPKSFPLLVQHGSADDVVPESLGREAVDKLIELGYAPQWDSYPMGHEVCAPELQRLGKWLSEVLN